MSDADFLDSVLGLDSSFNSRLENRGGNEKVLSVNDEQLETLISETIQLENRIDDLNNNLAQKDEIIKEKNEQIMCLKQIIAQFESKKSLYQKLDQIQEESKVFEKRSSEKSRKILEQSKEIKKLKLQNTDLQSQLNDLLNSFEDKSQPISCDEDDSILCIDSADLNGQNNHNQSQMCLQKLDDIISYLDKLKFLEEKWFKIENLTDYEKFPRSKMISYEDISVLDDGFFSSCHTVNYAGKWKKSKKNIYNKH
ncbi:MAG: hypothetical protein MHPSP_002923 [Paramarteilia canceri]